MSIKKQFGIRLKKLRKAENLSQEVFALRSDVDRTYIQSIEKGERNVSIIIIQKISKALNISVSDLMEGL